ncbi:serine/threonine protein kinase [Akkermansiaceae bacterium]|nr:serine/threonine protein kinase [Akkermansiaceae bacterium]MDB4143095.1 serine/threonine protein kinase [Akkermansiaceae bacterium]MDB4259885.1 serine/threonine protein kinase [Akkermansiaceae bacterium]
MSEPDSEPITAVLEFCSGCKEELDVTTFEPFSNVICPYCGVETRVKRQLGNYYLERRYAVGGMSVVYLATDQTLDREVAVKVLNEDYSADETRVAAFESEARLTAAVNHPNVVQVYTVGRAYDRFYLVMELIGGQSFEAVMGERGALPEDEVLDIALQVTKGLRAANDAGVLHRDVKPGNILLSDDGRTKLVDFGLALITQGGSATAEEVWATPYYVPPEALDRSTEDFRSDLYAFGATLYHALAGKPPFESTTNGTKVLRRAKQTIPRLGKVAPWLGDATCEAIDRMMAYQPKHRWGSYEEVLSILRKARNEATDACGLEDVGNRAQRRARKNRWLAPTAAIVVIGGFAAALLTLKPWGKEEEKRTVIEPKAAEMIPVEESFDSNKHLTESWSFARGLVAKDDFKRAEAKFLELSKDEALGEPTRSFAKIEAGISASLDGRAGDARQHAREVHRHLKKLPKKNRASEKLEHLALILSKAEPPSARDLSDEPKSIVDWMGLTALTLKLWEQGMFAEAQPLLEKIKKSGIRKDFDWFSIYQEQTEKYLHDASLIAKANDKPLPRTHKEARVLLDDLEQRLSLIQTRGRIRFNIRSKQIYLTRLRKGFELRPESEPTLNFTERIDEVRERAGERRFKLAGELIYPEDMADQAAAVTAWTYLLDQGSAFLSELEKVPTWEAETTSGEVLKFSGLTDEGAKKSTGEILELSQIKTKSLMAVHNAAMSAQINVTERFAMREQAIVFAWLSGMREAAETEAEELAAASPEFSKIWRQVLVGTSQ